MRSNILLGADGLFQQCDFAERQPILIFPTAEPPKLLGRGGVVAGYRRHSLVNMGACGALDRGFKSLPRPLPLNEAKSGFPPS